MPEACEVRCISISLNGKLSGKILTSIEFDDKSKYRNGLPSYEEFKEFLPCTITGVTCKSKCIIFLCSSNNKQIFITSTLGLEGKWTVGDKPFSKHSNLWFNLEDEEGNNQKAYFTDTRHFGNIKLHLNLNDLSRKLSKIGIDYLLYAISIKEDFEIQDHEKIPYDLWYETAISPRWKYKQICSFLMEQGVFSGIGNYLKAEILYRARIRPNRPICELRKDELKLIYKCIFDIIYESFMAGGLTIKTFWDPDGNIGTFKKVVYDQKTDPLGNPVVKDKFSDGRTTHWVKEVQI